MKSSGFVALQTFATLALAIATEQFATHNFWVGVACGVLGIAAYVAYELLPIKQ